MTATVVLGNLRLGGEVLELAGSEWTVLVAGGAFSVRTRVVILDEEWVL